MNRRKKVFNRVVNPLLHKYFTDPNIEEHSIAKNIPMKYLTDPHGPELSIAKNIPMKYLPYFKEITGSGNGMKVRYRFRGNSKLLKVNKSHDVWYDRPQSFCHMHGADTFAVYGR